MKLLSGYPKLENLETSYVNGVKDDGGYFKPLSNLIKASISLFEVPFRAVYNVKTLTIFELGRNLRNEETNSYYKALPVFENLTKLQLEWIQGTHDWDEVVNMLQNCPTLQTLEIEKQLHCELPDAILSQIPGCRHTPHLERLDSTIKFIVEFIETENKKLSQFDSTTKPSFWSAPSSTSIFEEKIM
ncbi:unnamed protein product [Trifolium pratense]|uniref:Uncharacterized protein n=1 Tax=Trifolium pratense TaxID=57577 RepID=A0ACB0JYC5_TRIPR|nr:unnamed protein product [Trifolium pratense]